MSATTHAIPARQSHDADLRALGLPIEDITEVILLEVNGSIVAGGTIDSAGPPTEPDTPLVTTRSSRDLKPEEYFTLVEALVDLARAIGLNRVLIGCDPMDHPRLRNLETLGFTPTGHGPYINLGGGQVQYITGYQSAEGSTIDLAAEL